MFLLLSLTFVFYRNCGNEDTVYYVVVFLTVYSDRGPLYKNTGNSTTIHFSHVEYECHRTGIEKKWT